MQRRDQFLDSRLNPAARAINSIYDRCIAREDATRRIRACALRYRQFLDRHGAGDRSSNQVGPSASVMWGIARVAAMLWIYWDTFWSLFFSAVWFMTIVSHPDTEITG
jgi:hypothetical protein